MTEHSENEFKEFPLLDLQRSGPASTQTTPDANDPFWRKKHRKRLRDRFMGGGASAMPDYELLELILFHANARQDMKPLAHKLIKEFGSFNEVISAPEMRLAQIKGVGARVIQELKIAEAVAHRLAKSKVMGKEVLSSWDALITYCQTAMAHRDTEQFRILFLDKKNILIADEAQQTGTVDHVPVYPREVAKRSLELNASAIILVHNHPSGDPSPSDADIDMTAQIERALNVLKITLHDHVIIGKNGITSFHDLDLL